MAGEKYGGHFGEVLRNKVVNDEEISNSLKVEVIWCGGKVFNTPGKRSGNPSLRSQIERCVARHFHPKS